MNFEKQLDVIAKSRSDIAYEYLEDPDSIQEDGEAFIDAMFNKDVAQWAANTYLKNSYATAKKILDTI